MPVMGHGEAGGERQGGTLPRAEPPSLFDNWVEALFERHLAELTWSEIARALGALTQDYVQRRHRLQSRRALAGRGKRAAFVLYYAPRHYLLVREALLGLGALAQRPDRILDLGCGIAVAGAAWSGLYTDRPPVLGVDMSEWLLAEARRTYRALGVPGRTLCARIERLPWPRTRVALVAAFALNELHEAARAQLFAKVLQYARAGRGTLVLEPLAKRTTPWWSDWARSVTEWGGRADEWHFDGALPEPVARLGRSAGLDPGKLGARTLWLPPAEERV